MRLFIFISILFSSVGFGSDLSVEIQEFRDRLRGGPEVSRGELSREYKKLRRMNGGKTLGLNREDARKVILREDLTDSQARARLRLVIKDSPKVLDRKGETWDSLYEGGPLNQAAQECRYRLVSYLKRRGASTETGIYFSRWDQANTLWNAQSIGEFLGGGFLDGITETRDPYRATREYVGWGYVHGEGVGPEGHRVNCEKTQALFPKTRTSVPTHAQSEGQRRKAVREWRMPHDGEKVILQDARK